MPRLPRYALAGQPQHVIQRGNNRSAIFATTADYCFFGECVARACTSHQCHVHAYVLMPNHVHLLITPLTPHGIGRVMQSVGRRYVHHFNRTYRRTGGLFEGRYRATPVHSERYLVACYRYIELNPVRAGLATRPGDYPWSSHASNAYGRHDPLVIPHDRFLALGGNDATRHAAYRALFRAVLEERTLREIRYATHKGWALGGDRFRRHIEERAGRPAAPRQRGRKSRA